MAWFMTSSPEEYLAAAGDFLLSRLAENTVLVTVAETIRLRGPQAFGDADTLFGWWQNDGNPDDGSTAIAVKDAAVKGTMEGTAVKGTVVDGTVVDSAAVEETAVKITPVADTAVEGTTLDGIAVKEAAVKDGAVEDAAVEGAFVHSQPLPVLLSGVPRRAAAMLAANWPRGRLLAGVNASDEVAAAFAAAWQQRTSAESSPRRRERLYRLGDLVPPSPAPAGGPRVATAADRDLLVAWITAFQGETSGVTGSAGNRVDDRLSHGGLTLWEVDGAPVSLAGATRPISGMTRIGLVYTPPDFRRHGYAGAVTAAVSQAARKAGTREILLFTDLANPTSNGVYQRLGFVPLGDRVVLGFAPAPPT